MEVWSPSQSSDTVTSPDSSLTSPHIQDYRHDDAREFRFRPISSSDDELDHGSPENRTGREPSGYAFRDQHMLEVDMPGRRRSETDEEVVNCCFPFRSEDSTRERRAVEYYGERAYRRSYRVERDRSSSCNRRCRSRSSSERRREQSESPRRRRPLVEYRYGEEQERRRRSFRPASMGYFLRRRYLSLSFTVFRSHSRSRVWYRRTQWQPPRRAYYPVRSTQLDRHCTRRRSISADRSAPCESAMSGEQESSRIIDADPPVVDRVNFEAERVIPKQPLAGYHLEDPRKEDYAPGFRHDSHPQEHELVDHTVSTQEQSYEVRQVYGSSDASFGPNDQIPNDSTWSPIIRAYTAQSSDMNHAQTRDNGLVHHHNLQRVHYLNHEDPDISVTCTSPVESLVNCHPGGPSADGYLVNYCPAGPRPEECLITYCPRPLIISQSVGATSQTSVSSLRGLHDGGTKLGTCFQSLTSKDASMMRPLAPDGERTWFDYPRELADRIAEGMFHTIRTQNDKVDTFRADMRDFRIRMANFVEKEKVAQEQSLAFIAAVKRRMAEQN